MQCLFFHRILLTRRIEDYSDGLDPTIFDFRAMLRRLRRAHHFVSTRELAETLAAGRGPDPAWVHLSVDDGFASSLVAAETCRDFAVPLTVFVSSQVVKGLVPWFVIMRHALASAERKLVLGGDSFDPRDPRQALQLNGRIKAEVYASPHKAEDALRTVLSHMGCDELPPLPDKHKFLDREGIRQLVAMGVEVGGHGASHCSLQGLESHRLRAEVRDSRRELSEICGVEPSSFAYPDGRYDDAARQAVVDAGYDIAFATGEAGNASDRFAVPRKWLGRDVESVGRSAGGQWMWRLWGRAKARWARFT